MAFPTVAEQGAWLYIFGALVLVVAALAAFANGLTLLALRRRHGLHHILGTTTFLLLRCMTTVDLVNALVGLPLTALDKMFGDSVQLSAFWCGVLMVPTQIMYSTGIWYLSVIALVRLFVILWPVRAKRWLNSTIVNVVLCAAPFVLSCFAQLYALAKVSMRFGRYLDRCQPLPYEYTEKSLQIFTIDYQLVTLLMSVLIPLSTTFVAYIIIYIVLLYRHRRQQQNRVGTTTTAPLQPPLSDVVASNTLGGQQGKGALYKVPDNSTMKATATGVNTAAATADPYVTQYRRRRNVVTILVVVYACNLLCSLPLYILWLSGFLNMLDKTLAQLIFGDMVQLMYLMALPLNAITYGLTSKDFKRAYKSIWRKWANPTHTVVADTTQHEQTLNIIKP